MSREFGKSALSRKILMALGETIEGLFELGIIMIFDPHYFLRHPYCGAPRKDFNKTVGHLKRSGYLEEKKNKIYLTEKGREKIIKIILKNKRNDKKEKKNWDKKWRGIIFDIPELSRKERDFLRKELKWIGFKEIQKSVWIYPFDIEKELKALLNLWKKDFEGDIRLVLIEKMNDEDLKRYFDLNY